MKIKNLKRLLTAYMLAKGVAKYRRSRQKSPADNNEKCENYYCCDDIDNDGRGNY